MADLAQLERALINADAAGDVDAAKALAGEIGRMRNQPQSAPQEQDTSIAQHLGNLVGGAVRGAGSIGSTILAPYDVAKAALEGKGLTLDNNRQRRAGIDSGLQMMGAEPDSAMYKGGKLGAEIAGTAGAGGAIAKGLGAIPGVASVAPKLLSAIESGGFSLGSPAASTAMGKIGDMAARTIGGAAVGGASAGMVDPSMAGSGAMIGAAIPGAVKTAGALGSLAGGAVKKGIGALTGVGDEAVNTAFKAGRQGNRTFLENMRGHVPITDVLDDAKTALSKIREARGAEYRQNMAGITKDKTVLDFSTIQQALNNLKSGGTYKGKVINQKAAGTVDEIASVLDDWGKSNPAEFHTPEGLDALKKAIGDIRDSTQFGTPARRAADEIYNTIKRQITAQAPDYAKAMKSYSEASELVSEIERSLVGKERTSVDTAMRKLQSLMRNNVNTNYGNRLNLAGKLEEQGADILPAVAGQSMNSMLPRGLARLGATGMGMSSMLNPAALAALPMTSPRLMGEALYGLGRVGGGAENAASAAMTNPRLAQMAAALRNPQAMSMMTAAPAIGLTAP
jgi:hypothetical protein